MGIFILLAEHATPGSLRKGDTKDYFLGSKIVVLEYYDKETRKKAEEALRAISRKEEIPKIKDPKHPTLSEAFELWLYKAPTKLKAIDPDNNELVTGIFLERSPFSHEEIDDTKRKSDEYVNQAFFHFVRGEINDTLLNMRESMRTYYVTTIKERNKAFADFLIRLYKANPGKHIFVFFGYGHRDMLRLLKKAIPEKEIKPKEETADDFDVAIFNSFSGGSKLLPIHLERAFIKSLLDNYLKSTKRPKMIKHEIIKRRADEISYTLCMHLKERDFQELSFLLSEKKLSGKEIESVGLPFVYYFLYRKYKNEMKDVERRYGLK